MIRVGARQVEGDKYTVGAFDGPALPKASELDTLSFDGIYMRRTCKAPPLEWLIRVCADRAIRYLELECPLGGTLPAEMLSAIEVLELLGGGSIRVAAAAASNLRVLTVRGRLSVEGTLRSCPNLTRVFLGRYEGTDLAEFDGCRRLESLKLVGKHQSVEPAWSDPPLSLEHFISSSIYLESLAAFAATKRLKTLSVDVARPRRTLPVLSLRPLESCRGLEWLELWRGAELTDVDALAGLPSLSNVVLEEGRFSPVEVEGLPVTIVPARKGGHRPPEGSS